MSRFYAFCAALVALLVAPVTSAQITITRADIEAYLQSSGTASSFELASPPSALQALADRSGPNQTWDLTAFTWTPGEVSTFRPATGTVPGSEIPEFQEATHVIEFDVPEGDAAYSYFRIGDGFDVIGVVGTDEDTGETLGLRFDPYERGFPLPLTSGATWSEAYSLEFIPAFEGITADATETSTVEGWGTLVTPAGQLSVLKVRTKTVSTSTIEAEGQEPIVMTDSLYTIEFISTSGAGAMITLDGEGVVDYASYTVLSGGTTAGEGGPHGGALDLALRSANPVRRGGPIEVGFALEAAGDVAVEAYDALGRRVATLTDGTRSAGPQRVVLATDTLPAGVYVVRVRAGTEAGALRVTVTD
ncbi:hypothetical protein [Rubrivirga marina]|nr:hypothetical protein [Rubrivirga marina]